MLQELWDQVLKAWPYSDRALWTFLMFFAHFIVWYPACIIIYAVSNMKAFNKYKIQQGKYPDSKLHLRGWLESILIHFTVQPLAGYYFIYPLFATFGTVDLRAPLPTFSRFAIETVVSLIILDTYFYWVHRAMHHFPVAYRLFHKKHHAFNVTTGVASEYATTVEDVFLNYASTFAGPLLVCSHPITGFFFIFLRMSESLEAHSGYQLPFAAWRLLAPIHDGAKFHDFHHAQQVGNYGVFTVWDWLMKTDTSYRNKLKNKANY